MSRALSPAGGYFIKTAEAEGGAPRLTAYRDTGGVWTIGWGHTAGVTAGMTCTLEQAQAWFDEDTADAVRIVNRLVSVPLSQEQFDALASFAYNVGSAQFGGSTLLRKLNSGDYTGAADELRRWVYDDGKRIEGLAARRERERTIFLAHPAPAAEPSAELAGAGSAPAITSESGISEDTTMPSNTPDTVAAAATVAGALTGNVWLAPALTALRALWPELRSLFAAGTSEVAQRNVRAAEAVVDAVIAATGAKDAPDAVRIVQTDPAAAQQARGAAIDIMDDYGLVEVGGGIPAARQAAAATGTPAWWSTGAAAVTLGLLPLVYYVVIRVLQPGEDFSGELRAAVVSAVVTGALGAILGFWLGTSFKNSVKPAG